MEYVLRVLVIATLYAVLAGSLDLQTGHTGLLSLAHAAFFGLGAYASAIVAIRGDAGFATGVLAGVAVAVLMSFAVSLPSLRLHGDYFVIATFGFQTILFHVFNNWMAVTQGPLGIRGIPPPIICGWQATSSADFLLLAVVLLCLAYLIVYRLASSPFGRVLHAIREDETFVTALGKNTLYFTVTAVAVSGALAAMAGSVYAHYATYIDPTGFTVMESILVISMVIIGGAGSVWGPLLGAIVLVALPEALRFIGLPSGMAANLREIMYGCLLIAVMMFRPRGLVGKYALAR